MVTVLVSVVAVVAVAADVGGIGVAILYVALLTIITNITNSSFLLLVMLMNPVGFLGEKKCIVCYFTQLFIVCDNSTIQYPRLASTPTNHHFPGTANRSLQTTKSPTPSHTQMNVPVEQDPDP